MNRTYFAGNYYVGNNGVGRTNLITSPIAIPGIWANYCPTLYYTAGCFLIDGTGKVFFVGDDTARGNSGTNIASMFTSPVSIARPGSYKDVASVYNGFTSIFLDGSDGSIWGSGYNGSGQLGNNTLTSISSPVSLARPGSYSKIMSDYMGTSAAIEGSTGNIWVWGAITGANLPVTSRSSPISLARPGSYRDIAAANADGVSLIAMIDASNGSVWCAGRNTYGQLGNNSLLSASSPVSIARPGSYSKIAAADNVTYAIDASDGSMWQWGKLLWSNVSYSSPVSIARPGSYKDISAHAFIAVAIDGSDGSLWAWGYNTWGMLGDGTTIPSSSPVSVLGGRSYISVKVGRCVVYAQTSDGTVYTWGIDNRNTMGRQAVIYTKTIIPILSSLDFSKIQNNIFLDTGGNVYCTGSGGVGSIGNNTLNDYFSPVSIARPGSYTDVATTSNILFLDKDPWVSCAAIDGATGNIWTWGYNNYGQLGNNTVLIASSPVSLARPGSYKMVCGGNVCFLSIDASNGSIWAWGYSSLGQLGDGRTTNQSSPVSFKRPGSYSAVFTGFYSTFAIDASDGSLWACGSNNSGQLGNGTLVSTSSPVSVLGGRSYIDIVCNSGILYALTADGTVYALGDNTYGEFGNGTTISSSSPVALPFQSVTAINRTNSLSGLFTINAVAPVVDTQPSNTEKVQGQTATFTVTAHGNPAL
jgi:alpha-tubulin suppressor-like RCC1 family protein